jgi:excisionase family DNA binding protein
VDQLLLTPEHAAELLAVGRTKIYELLRTGALESVRIGAARRIPAAALTAYVDKLRRDEAADVDGYRGMAS